MTPERVQTDAERDADEESRRRRLADPAVKAKVREIQESIRQGDERGRGVGAEGLPGLLRDHR